MVRWQRSDINCYGNSRKKILLIVCCAVLDLLSMASLAADGRVRTSMRMQNTDSCLADAGCPSPERGASGGTPGRSRYRQIRGADGSVQGCRTDTVCEETRMGCIYPGVDTKGRSAEISHLASDWVIGPALKAY